MLKYPAPCKKYTLLNKINLRCAARALAKRASRCTSTTMLMLHILTTGEWASLSQIVARPPSLTCSMVDLS